MCKHNCCCKAWLRTLDRGRCHCRQSGRSTGQIPWDITLPTKMMGGGQFRKKLLQMTFIPHPEMTVFSGSGLQVHRDFCSIQGEDALWEMAHIHNRHVDPSPPGGTSAYKSPTAPQTQMTSLVLWLAPAKSLPVHISSVQMTITYVAKDGNNTHVCVSKCQMLHTLHKAKAPSIMVTAAWQATADASFMLSQELSYNLAMISVAVWLHTVQLKCSPGTLDCPTHINRMYQCSECHRCCSSHMTSA